MAVIITRGGIVSSDIEDSIAGKKIPPQSGERCYSGDGVDLTLIRWRLSLTPAEGLEVLQSAVNSILDIREQNPKT